MKVYAGSSYCKFIHACSYCGDGHPKSVCPQMMHVLKKKKESILRLSNVPQLSRALRKHPNRCFMNYLLTGLVQGFLAGITLLLKKSHVCKKSSVNS